MFVAIYTTFPTLKEASLFSRKAIEERLGACANIISGVKSIYRWNETIEEEEEVIVWLKTRESLVKSVEILLKSVHPYDTPAFVVYKIHTGSEEYLQWIKKETTKLNINK